MCSKWLPQISLMCWVSGLSTRTRRVESTLCKLTKFQINVAPYAEPMLTRLPPGAQNLKLSFMDEDLMNSISLPSDFTADLRTWFIQLVENDGLVWGSRSCVARTEAVWFNRLMWVNVSRHFRYNYLMVPVGWMISSSPRDTSGHLLTLMIVINQMKQNSVIMRMKRSADTNNTQLLAILLFLLWQRMELWSMTSPCFVVPELMLLFSQLESVL